MLQNTNLVVQKNNNSIVSQARILAYKTTLIVRKDGDVISPITILKQSSSGLLNTLPSLPTSPPTYIL